MELFKIKKDIPFMKNALVFNAISFVTFALAVFFLFSRGLHLSVEFTGGTLMEVSFSQPVALDPMRERIAALGYTDVQVQHFGSARDVLIRMPAAKGATATEQSARVMAALQQNDTQATLKRTEFVGPQVGDELAIDGVGKGSPHANVVERRRLQVQPHREGARGLARRRDEIARGSAFAICG